MSQFNILHCPQQFVSPKLGAVILMLGTLASFAGLVATGWGQDQVFRGPSDVRVRPPDELDRPRYKERWTHRGRNLRTNELVVVANTRVEDARWVVDQAFKTWQQMKQLAENFSTAHHQPDFGIGAVQIFVDGEAPKRRDQPATTLDVVGVQAQIHIYLGEGQPALQDQILRLRHATALAYFHTAEMDRQLPPWVCDGLAAYVAETGLAEVGGDKPPAAGAAAREVSLPPALGGQQWRSKRAADDQLEPQLAAHAEAAAHVRFLLTGNDAEHAPEFMAALQVSIAEVNQARVQGNRITARRGESQPAATSRVDGLLNSLAREYDQWRRDPQIGQPVMAPDAAADAPSIALQGEMLVALKLLRRFPSGATTTLVRTRVAVFDKDRGLAVKSDAASAGPLKIADFYRQLTNPDHPAWATLDSQGQLLFSSNIRRLQELFGPEQQRFQIQRQDDRLALVARLESGKTLHGWLEENPRNPSRPIAKFALLDRK